MEIIKVRYVMDIPENFTGIAEYWDGSKYWYKNGEWHHEDGPAVIYPDGSKQYFINDKLHRTDGPAVEHADGYKRYYINGKEVTKEAQELLYFFMKLKGL